MISHGKDIKVFSGNSNPKLAEEICKLMGTKLGESEVGTFSDGEIFVSLYETVRGSDVFVVQSTCSPVNDNLMELLIMIDALKRASAGRITAVIPYYGYARQDRKVSPRAPISAKLVADFLSTAGANRVVTVDLHAGQIQGFFNCPVDNLFASQVLLEPFMAMKGEIVVVSPDAGGVERARSFAKRIEAPLAIIDKRRDRPNQATATHVIGDVDGKIAVIEGVEEFKGAPVRAHDLRAGAAMVIAGLAAKGVTEVEQVQNIERGYETLVEKFVALGADMYRSEIPDSMGLAERA